MSKTKKIINNIINLNQKDKELLGDMLESWDDDMSPDSRKSFLRLKKLTK